MNDSPRSFDLPLLTKDLIEQSARRRMYVLRVAYALLLYGAALWIYGDIAGGGVQSSLSNLGRGREFFDQLVGVQFLAIIVLLPALTCGAITAEKERDTLGLLLLTQLSPRTIVLEKLLSRLIAMGTYQLLSLPLFAVVYGMGGVELHEVFGAIWMLFWWSAAVGAWGIYCSTWHRTTAGAFVSAYLFMPIVYLFGMSCFAVMLPPSGQTSLSGLTTWRFALVSVAFLFYLLSIALPLAIVSGGLILAAQYLLVERAFVPPRNLLLESFRKLDGFFEWLNQRTTRGMVLARDGDFLPLFDPIAWRETRKKSLGTVRYLFRLLVLLEAPLAVVISFTLTDSRTNSFDGPNAFFLSLLWPIAVVAVVVHATGVLASERSRQTLDLLLVAPIPRETLVREKLAGVRRLIAVLTVPFATLIVFQAVWNLYVIRGLNVIQNEDDERSLFLHDVIGLSLATIVYLPLLQWIAFHVALRIRNQTQAVLTSIAVVIALCALPWLVLTLLLQYIDRPAIFILPQWLQAVTWLSPIRVLFHRQFTQLDPDIPIYLFWAADARDGWPAWPILHFSLAVVAWFLLRRSALRRFSALVGRTEADDASAQNASPS